MKPTRIASDASCRTTARLSEDEEGRQRRLHEDAMTFFGTIEGAPDLAEKRQVRSARAAYSFIDDAGASQVYLSNASSIYVEKGENITIRNCVLHDCGNGSMPATNFNRSEFDSSSKGPR